ncbi:MAG: RNA polymerase sigma factor [Acidobacteria bacterium]|nr:RNA polymerase sigma factor [Acidobacteriota bacterium]
MTSSTIPDDAELLRLISAGDEDAFTALYRRRQGGVYRFALQMSGSEAIAEDVTQEVFLVLMRDAHHYDPTRGSLSAYLYGIARNHILRAFERERRWVALPDDGEEADEQFHERLVAQDDPLDDLMRGDMIERLHHAVLALPTHYREVVVLCELHELSYAETAGALGCAVGTVRSRLHRARSMLIERMRTATTRDGAAAEATEKDAEAAGDDVASHAFKTARCFV